MLDFIPFRLTALGDELLIVPAVVGRFPSTLLFRLNGGRVNAETLPPSEFADVSVKMMGNFLATATLGDRLLLVHQFLTPRAYIWRPERRLERPAVPLPSEVRSAVGYRPSLPLDEEALKPALVVALAAAADSINRQFVFLTRSGRMRGPRFEKALIRTDSAFNFLSASVLAVNAGHFALLTSRNAAVVVDEEDRWYTCPLS